MYAMGDSYFGGSTLGKSVTWVNKLGNKYKMNYVNYGIGGSTMSDFVTNKEPMVKRIVRMKRDDANIILLEGGKYYLYGTRFDGEVGTFPQEADGTDVYVSDDLENFSNPIPVFRKDESFWGTHHFWAPEVHKYNNKYYMFVTVASKTRNRGVQILVCDSPDGKFKPVINDAITPSEWECLDGTLYVENGLYGMYEFTTA
jgi:hypothetical protein